MPSRIIPSEILLGHRKASGTEEESKTPKKINTLVQDLYPVKLYNKMEGNEQLSNKKNLFSNLKAYYESIGEDPFITLPLTFLVKDGINDQSFISFREYFEQNPNLMWIIKPGENSNRGQGIKVVKDLKEIQSIVERANSFTRKSTIIQKYIQY